MKQRESLLPDFFSALGHPSRIRIIEELREGEICQCMLPELLDLEQSNLSRHIKILSMSGVISTRRDGVKILLSVSDPLVFELIDDVKSVLQSRLMLLHAELE